MNEPTLEKICEELAPELNDMKFGRIFPLARLQFAIDFRLADAKFLFVSFEPSAPRIYLIRRRLRDLEKLSINSNSFVMFLRKRLAHAVLRSLEKVAGERVLKFSLAAENELGEPETYVLVVQLTGRSANLFLLDERGFILDALRTNSGDGQENGMRYAPPFRDAEKRRGDGETRRRRDEEIFSRGEYESLSEALDHFYLEKEAETAFQAKAKTARARLKSETTRREKLVKKLSADLENHGDPAAWKRSGDLILANLADAVVVEGKLLVVDYFDEETPTVEIEIDENDSLTETAEKFFRRYTKARNAREEIGKRIEAAKAELENLSEKNARLETAAAEKDLDALEEFIDRKAEKPAAKTKDKRADTFRGARRFVSSDGYEVLVGKASKDNDFLTFRVAKSLDLWLHAADYPGSHVVVRNPNRQEIPQKTLLEAAQAAAFYSNARQQPKVAVHYTQKKHVNKPKGAALGLVSLSSFKTILVEPNLENLTLNEEKR